MNILTLQQGSPEWHEARAKRFTASEAPAMAGVSKHMTRDQLLRQKATGEVPEVSEAQQRIFNNGHDAEASARPVAEEIVGHELFPCTCVDDSGAYLASMDGLTMMEDIGFEHKLINNDLRGATAETLAEHYKVQMDHQMMVTGAEKILFMASDGTEGNCVWFWYPRDEGRIARLIEGWEQFAKDLEAYEPREPEQEVIAAAQTQLPAVSVRLDGQIAVISNLDKFGRALTAYVEQMNLEPETDQEFADLEAACKNLKKAEDALQAAEDNALAQMAAVEEMRRTKAQYYEISRQARLAGEKAVKAQKQAIKVKIAYEAKAQFDEHIATLNKALGGNYMPTIQTDFNGAMKNKRTIDSLRSAANDECECARIEANRIASRIEANLETLKTVEASHQFLFADKVQLVQSHETEALKAIVKQRVAEHEEAEHKREEQIRADERAKAEQSAVVRPAPVAQATPLHGPHGSVAYNADGSKAKPEQEASKPRPTDKEIIEVLARHYGAHPVTVIGWLHDMDTLEAGEALGIVK